LIGDGDTFVSRIHVDDLVEAIWVLGGARQLAHSEYVVGDSEPTTGRAHASGVAERLGLPSPKSVDAESVPEATRSMLSADRRIVPKRLYALGWRPRYPSWREGLEQALAEEAEQPKLEH
jgi:nucleoside-diphosphate-sugar epimerase